jgi:hypothetical protein
LPFGLDGLPYYLEADPRQEHHDFH